MSNSLALGLQLAFWAVGAVLFGVYFGYPLYLYLHARLRPSPVKAAPITPSVTVLICAHNEEAVIGPKVENTLSQDYPGELEVLVVSDGSSDRTNEILEGYGTRIRTALLPENRGKTAGISESIHLATGDIVVFTDANVRLADDAVRLLVQSFADESVGCVCGQLTYVNSSESATAENHGIYWKYEEFIKRQESRTGSVSGADGSIFAIRRLLFEPLPPICIDDFATSMLILAAGWRVVFDERAKAYEKSSTTLGEDLHRRRRISNRLSTTERVLAEQLKSMSTGSRVRFWLHKRLRWQTMQLMLLILVINVALVGLYGLYEGWLVLQVAFYVAAAIGGLLGRMGIAPGPLQIPFYFVASNAFQMLGRIESRLKPALTTWTPPATTRRF